METVGSDTSVPFQHVIDALTSVGSKMTVNGRSATAQCPTHDDEHPSLSVTDGGDRVLINCHSGCDTTDIVEVLGLTMADLFNEPTPRIATRPVAIAEYVYRDENGEPLFRVVRHEPKDFRQHQWNGTSWDTKLGTARRVLYRLPELMAAVAASKWVFIVEGEKDAGRLVAAGFPATTIAMGANPGNWDKTETSVLDGASVAVIADNDRTGRKYARFVANSLDGRAAEVRLIRLDGLLEGGDVSDWLDDGRTLADLVKILESTPGWKPKHRFDGAKSFVTVGDVSVYLADSLRPWARKRTEWRIRGVLVKDTHLVVGAAKKTFKTTLVSGEMAFAIANGTPWLDHEQFVVEAQAPVIVVINEGIKSYMRSLDRIPTRHQADSLGPIYVIDASGFKLENSDLNAAIREAAERVGAEVIIYDAWYGFVGGDADASNLFSMSDVFKIVQDVANELDIDPVIVHHLKKFSKGRPDLDNLTFAGIAEWADSWLLIVHRSKARPAEGEFRFGMVAGSRQWSEINYEIDASFGRFDVGNTVFTQPPRWHVAMVDADTADQWGYRSGGSSVDPKAALTDFVAAHPYAYTKSQVCREAPGGEKANRDAFVRLVESGTLVVAKLRRLEGNQARLRDLVGPSRVDPAETEQQRLAPIRDDLPTNVGQGGAGNSPEAAVSTLSEPPAEGNLGDPADVGNVDTPTLIDATPAPADVDSRSSRDTDDRTADVLDPPESENPPLCDKCDQAHEPPLPGDIDWACFAIQAERDMENYQNSR